MSKAPSLYLALLGFAAVLTFFASLCELILAGIVQHRRNYALSQANSGWLPANGTNQLLPPYILLYSNGISFSAAREITSAAVTLLFSSLTIRWTVSSIGSEHRVPARKFSIRLCIVAAVVILLNTGLLAWIFIIHDRSDTLEIVPARAPEQPDFFDTELFNLYWNTTLDWEVYLCTIAPQVRQYDGGDWFATSCTYTVASRWTMVPLFALSFITSVLLWTAAGSYSTRPPLSAAEVRKRIVIKPPEEKQNGM